VRLKAFDAGTGTLVQVSKTGWAYIPDRETGEPLIGIEERLVMQEPRQATAAMRTDRITGRRQWREICYSGSVVTATGRNTMPGFGAVYSAQDLRDVASFVLEQLARQ